MKKFFLSLATICICAVLGHGQSKQKKVLFVIVDGISADTKEKIKTPNLDAIAKVGGY